MRAFVDEELCIGCGICGDVCPEVFVVETKAEVIADPVPGGAEDCCRQAEEECPVTAISLEE